MILPASSAASAALSAALPPITLRVILHACILTRLFLGAHLLACELRILLLADGLKALLDIDLVLHIALNVPRLIGLGEHHLHTDWRDIHGGTCLSLEDSYGNFPIQHLQPRIAQLFLYRLFHPVDRCVDPRIDGIGCSDGTIFHLLKLFL